MCYQYVENACVSRTIAEQTQSKYYTFYIDEVVGLSHSNFGKTMLQKLERDLCIHLSYLHIYIVSQCIESIAAFLNILNDLKLSRAESSNNEGLF